MNGAKIMLDLKKRAKSTVSSKRIVYSLGNSPKNANLILKKV